MVLDRIINNINKNQPTLTIATWEVTSKADKIGKLDSEIFFILKSSKNFLSKKTLEVVWKSNEGCGVLIWILDPRFVDRLVVDIMAYAYVLWDVIGSF